MELDRYSNSQLLLPPDCMGLSRTGKCTWLNCKACTGKNCAFKRSEEECRSSSTYTLQRLASLEDSRQAYISDKYYKGRRPWNKYCVSGGEAEENNR